MDYDDSDDRRECGGGLGGHGQDFPPTMEYVNALAIRDLDETVLLLDVMQQRGEEEYN